MTTVNKVPHRRGSERARDGSNTGKTMKIRAWFVFRVDHGQMDKRMLEGDKMSTGESWSQETLTHIFPNVPPTSLKHRVIFLPELRSLSLVQCPKSRCLSPWFSLLLTHLDKPLFRALALQLLACSTSTNLLFALIGKHFRVGKLGALLIGGKKVGEGISLSQ